MLLCDQCDLGFHMECLDPPLYQVNYFNLHMKIVGKRFDLFFILF